MFSPRILALFALLATISALPATDKPDTPRPITTITDISEDDIDDTPWFSFPLFGNLFTPLWRLFPSFADIGPRIIVDDDKFQIVVCVKDYKKEDLKVKVKNDFILVQGTHERKQDERDLFASQFFHTYSLPVNSSAADVTAELSSDGFLTVIAPISSQTTKSKDVDRDVPIVESGKPYKEEKTEAATTVKPPQESDDDRKEPTTPSPDVTENVIPHDDPAANEVSP